MTRRTQRVGEMMREVIGELLQRQVKDPRIGFVTITGVRVTPDLSRAHVYYTVLGDESAKAQTQEGLESASAFLRSEVGRRIRMKTLPELHFQPDEMVEHGQRVDELIEQIHHGPEGRGWTTLPPVAPHIEEALEVAADVLEDAEHVALACHLNPYVYALGSVLARALGVRALGKEVACGWSDGPMEVPAQYDYLPGQELLTVPERFAVEGVALAIDCATADRLGDLRERMETASTLLNIDHHISNTLFGKVNVVDDSAPSSSELILRLLRRLDGELTPELAVCLYTGLVTDTGRFSYANATPRAHHAAAYLIERGVEVDDVSQKVFESLPYGYLKTLGYVLERCELLEDPPLVISYLTQEDLRASGVTLDETEEVINVLRLTREADAAAVLKELEDGTWKGSLRSKGATDVSEIAKEFGGGGHRLAAGFTSTEGLQATIRRIHEGLRRVGSGETDERSS
jgi:bifunctional oligoribonuclease and PAP phosphatase NrnA